MPNISVKDVPDVWAEALRQRAVRNHRSLQGELMAIIERAVTETAQPLAAASGLQVGDFISPAFPQIGRVVGFDRFGEAIVQRSWKSAGQVSAGMRAQFPVDPVVPAVFDNAASAVGAVNAAGVDGPSSVDLIRQDRDSR